MIMAMILAAATSCGALPSQPAMNQCQQAAAEREDAEMNRVWRQTRAAMDEADREAASGGRLGGGGYRSSLVAAQRTWLTFRDAECVAESYEWKGGTMQPYTEAQCRVEVTRMRTRQLKALASSVKE